MLLRTDNKVSIHLGNHTPAPIFEELILNMQNSLLVALMGCNFF